MFSKCVCIGEGGGVAALQHWSCVYRRWDMDRDSSAIDAQTETFCVWVTVGLDAEKWGLSCPTENTSYSANGNFLVFTVLGCGCLSTLSLGCCHSTQALSNSHPFLQNLSTGGS